MNVEELSMIGPDVDLETVDAMSKKRLLTFINHFIINTSMFLNKLSKSCECGMMTLENKIQKLETSIIILESKLNSVPGLDVKESSEIIVPEIESQQEKVEEKSSDNESKNTTESADDVAEKTLDPSLMKFVKMLQYGVPFPAVKLKMTQEGIDLSLHDLVLNYNK